MVLAGTAVPQPVDGRLEEANASVLAAAKGSSFLAGGSFFEFASRFVIALLLARLLGAHDYGLYVLAIGGAAIFANVAALGLDDAMVRYIAIFSGRRDRSGLRGTLQVGIGASVAAGCVVAAVVFAAARPISEGLFDEPRLTALLRLAALTVPFLTVSNVLAGTARGLGRMGYVAFAENVVQSLVRLALLGAVALATRGMTTTWAVVIFGISDVSATVVFVRFIRRHVTRRGDGTEARRDVATIMRFALPLWLAGLLRQSRRNVETVLLGAARSVSSVGVYSVVDRINLVGHVWLLSIFLAVKPTLAQLHDRSDRVALARLYTTVTRWSLCLTLPFFLAMTLYPRAILSLFGDAFTPGATALVILAVAELVNAATGICGPMIDMTGHTRVKVLDSFVLTVVLIVSNAALIPAFGITGAATASLIGIAVFNLLCIVQVKILEGLLPFDRTFWKPAIAGAAAFATGQALDQLAPVGTGVALGVAQGLVVVAVFLSILLLAGLEEEDRAVLAKARARVSPLARRAARDRGPRDAGAAAPAPSGPIFIGGLDRSGKTTMAAFLTSHPNVAVPAVGSNMWTYFYRRFGDLGKSDNLDRCLAAMLRYRHVTYLEPDEDRIRRDFATGPPTYARLFALFLDHWAERQGKPRWGVQTGLIERYADQLFAADPRTRVVHLVRDPRDRYEGSLELWPDGRGRAGGATARWTYSMRLAERNARRYGDRYLIVRYEDMVLDPEATVRAVCEFLGETFVPEMLTMAGAPERRDRLASRCEPAEAAEVAVPLTAKFIGRYRERVPRHEVVFMQLHARRLMRRYGYAADRVELSPVEWLRFAALGWPSQTARMVAWRAVEAAQQHLPGLVGRRPDARLVDAPAGGRR